MAGDCDALDPGGNCSTSPRQAVVNLFRRFDSRGDGIFSCVVLAGILRALDGEKGASMTDQGINDLLRAMDTDKSGWIHYKVFCEFIFGATTRGSMAGVDEADSLCLKLLAREETGNASVLADSWGVRTEKVMEESECGQQAGELEALEDECFDGEDLPLPSSRSETTLVSPLSCEATCTLFSEALPPWTPRWSGGTVSLVSLAQDANEQFRPYMEDGKKVVDPLPVRHCTREDQWGFYAVYDGHGGRQEVEYCEERLHEVLMAELEACKEADVSSAFRGAFEKMDAQLAMLGAWKSGCTATVALVHRTDSTFRLHVANVGDSRAVVVGSAGCRRVTIDHKPSHPSEAARIVQDGGFVRHGRVGGQLGVSRSLGDHHLKSSGLSCAPEVSSCDIEADRAVVIASDGLWDALEDSDVGEVINRCMDRAVTQCRDRETIASYLRENVAHDLVELAKERGSRDNILALVVFF